MKHSKAFCLFMLLTMFACFTAPGQVTNAVDSFYSSVNARMQLQKVYCNGNTFEFYRSSVNISRSQTIQQFLKEGLPKLADSILLKGFLTDDSILVLGRKYPDGLRFSRVSCLVKRVVFYQTIFTSDIPFTNAILNNGSDILFANTDASLMFIKCWFQKQLVFDGMTFNKTVLFDRCFFDGDVHFRNNNFNEAVKFNSSVCRNTLHTKSNVFRDLHFTGDTIGTIHAEGDSVVRVLQMKDNTIGCLRLVNNTYTSNNTFGVNNFRIGIALINCSFTKELDLQKVNFNRMQYLRLENFDFPIGGLKMDWKQLFSRREPLIKVLRGTGNREAQIQLKELYDKLNRNLKEQEEEEFYNDCRYEARLQQYLHEDSKKEQWFAIAYDLFFGFGYKPLRFVLLIVLPCIFISSLLFMLFFKSIIVSLVSEGTYTKDDLNWLSRSAHGLFFASWVLFSLRFSNTWIRKNENRNDVWFFITVVAIWLLGIAMYISFAVYVKNDNFAFIRGIFGF